MGQKKGNWEVLEEHIYESFPIFQIKRSKRINLANGTAHDFFLMHGFDWVNIVAITPEGNMVMVKQFRHGSEDYTLETPGGCVEQGEAPEEAARRELLEETGYSADNLELLASIHPNPAFQSLRCHCYLARDVRLTSALNLDPTEDIEVQIMPQKEVFEMAREGKITHAIVLACLGLYKLL